MAELGRRLVFHGDGGKFDINYTNQGDPYSEGVVVGITGSDRKESIVYLEKQEVIVLRDFLNEMYPLADCPAAMTLEAYVTHRNMLLSEVPPELAAYIFREADTRYDLRYEDRLTHVAELVTQLQPVFAKCISRVQSEESERWRDDPDF